MSVLKNLDIKLLFRLSLARKDENEKLFVREISANYSYMSKHASRHELKEFWSCEFRLRRRYVTGILSEKSHMNTVNTFY